MFEMAMLLAQVEGTVGIGIGMGLAILGAGLGLAASVVQQSNRLLVNRRLAEPSPLKC